MLNFCGKVVNVPAKNSLFVCRAFERDFFITAGEFGSLDTDGFVPAWVIPEGKMAKAKAGAKAAKAKAKAEGPTMKLIQTEATFTYTYKSFFINKLTTQITVTSLVPDEQFFGQQDVMLTRPALPSLEAYGIGTIGPRQKIASAASSGSRTSLGSAPPSEYAAIFRKCKHLG